METIRFPVPFPHLSDEEVEYVRIRSEYFYYNDKSKITSYASHLEYHKDPKSRKYSKEVVDTILKNSNLLIGKEVLDIRIIEHKSEKGRYTDELGHDMIKMEYSYEVELWLEPKKV